MNGNRYVCGEQRLKSGGFKLAGVSVPPDSGGCSDLRVRPAWCWRDRATCDPVDRVLTGTGTAWYARSASDGGCSALRLSARILDTVPGLRGVAGARPHTNRRETILYDRPRGTTDRSRRVTDAAASARPRRIPRTACPARASFAPPLRRGQGSAPHLPPPPAQSACRPSLPRYPPPAWLAICASGRVKQS